MPSFDRFSLLKLAIYLRPYLELTSYISSYPAVIELPKSQHEATQFIPPLPETIELTPFRP